jgi:hypothetical protein
VTGVADQPIPLTAKADRYVFDVDAAVVAAQLFGAVAALYDLHALGRAPTYLTGDTPICSDPALDCFEVEDILPWRPRVLSQHLRTRNVGRLEIKKRGVNLIPEVIMHRLKLRGDEAATLLVSNIAGRPTAILAQRRTK